ncbi:unnamed protein product [Ambrosiozyma monospora]|uniref:Unnamed protein product n=1 Tax=Ambrosiozyma monospora TaxID=43982 RepID=A0ACB5U1T9_AMBMO|nr:unnamed protein product [Ambrosiozyma monospora]
MYDSQEGIHAPKRDSVDTAELLRSAGRRVDSSGTVIRKGEGRSKNEKRHSVLSLYSTKASSTCLSAYLNDIENDKKSNDVVDMDVSFDQNGNKTTSGSDDDLCFVNKSTPPKAKKNSDLLADAPALRYKSSKDTLMSDDSNDKNTNAMKLPEIPGSPIKEQKRKSQQSKFEIYEDANETKSAANDASKKADQKDASKSEKPVKLEVAKQRKPLGEIDENKKPELKRKGSFFRMLSFGKQEPVEGEKRKVSITQAFIGLFHGHDDVPSKDLISVLSPSDLYEALKSLLITWKQHGITNIKFDPYGRKIAATISKKNALGLKACKFGCEIVKLNTDKKSLAKSKIWYLGY